MEYLRLVVAQGHKRATVNATSCVSTRLIEYFYFVALITRAFPEQRKLKVSPLHTQHLQNSMKSRE